MRRCLAFAMIVSLSFWSFVYPSSVRADGDKDKHDPKTVTPIKHLVVIFQENESFDHYFGTYPKNDKSEPPFDADPDTPGVNGLTPTLLTNNPNKPIAGNPFLLTRDQALTCDNQNNYTPEQKAFDDGLLDNFNVTAPTAKKAAACLTGGDYLPGVTALLPSGNLEMGYYTGNTATALWNYAQHFAMSDNFFDTNFGGTVQGHLNLLSGQTNGVMDINGKLVGTHVPGGTDSAGISTTVVSDYGTVVNNINPLADDCATATPPATLANSNISMTGNNVGNLLSKANVTYGWFYDGFRSNGIVGGTPATCNNPLYNAHYAPFEYWPSTSNPHHLAPMSASNIGTTDQANHNYDYADLSEAIKAGSLPAVTFIKGSSLETGHPMDTTPLAEQTFLVDTVNMLEQSPYWKDMAIIIAWDDSDGWYDHVAGPIVNHSADSANDGIQSGACGALPAGADNDRCGFGMRLPFLVISPFAKYNYVDHSLNDTTSILRFIEYNWSLGALGSLGNPNDLQSFDVLASGSILGMFDFDDFPPIPENRILLLDSATGNVMRHDIHHGREPWGF